MAGIGLLAWKLIGSKKVALYSMVMMFSTPAFFQLMWGGKTDNASTQFGIAALLWLIMFPPFSWKTTWIAGLCIGWSLACRYTNIIIVPSFLIFLGALLLKSELIPFNSDDNEKIRSRWPFQLLFIAIFAAIGFAPMLIKIWVLVGCPLAPVLGCENAFWTNLYRQAHDSLNNITVADLLLYPFTWTYVHRINMLGNISPLFLGFLPLLIIYRRSRLVKISLIAGIAGLASFACWLLLHPLILFTRWLLLPLALFTVPLGAAFATADTETNYVHFPKLLMRSALVLIVVFTLFNSRGTIYGAAYLASGYSRDDAYHTYHPFPGYEAANWLNENRKPGERVVLNLACCFPPYFLDPDILDASETTAELQELWLHSELKTWEYYAAHDFKYILVTQVYLQENTFAFPIQIGNQQLETVFDGKDHVVLKISGAK